MNLEIKTIKTEEEYVQLDTINKILLNCYSKDLCYPKIRDNWKEDNKCFGMCAITALIVNDYFGGDICKIYVDNISHYFNLIDNKVIDLTSSQFKCDIDYSNYKIVNRTDMLNEDTLNRYNKLKEKMISILDSKEH